MRRGSRVVCAVVVLNGARGAEVERARRVGASLADTCLVVAVDGGLRACLRSGLRPDLLVGDRDSCGRVSPALPDVTYPADKAFSDLAGALGELSDRGVQILSVAGMLGGRLDHEWCNLLELGRAARWCAAIVAPTARGTLVLTRHGCRVKTVQGRSFTALALTTAAVVTLRGARWELERRCLRPGSSGLSNRSRGVVDLRVHRGTVGLVFAAAARRRGSRTKAALLRDRRSR